MAPIGPGLVAPAFVEKHKALEIGESVRYQAPDDRTLAFDGERERLLRKGEDIEISLRLDGPAILSVLDILKKAALRGDLRVKN